MFIARGWPNPTLKKLCVCVCVLDHWQYWRLNEIVFFDKRQFVRIHDSTQKWCKNEVDEVTFKINIFK